MVIMEALVYDWPRRLSGGFTRHLRELISRYGLPEVVATLTALAAAGLTYLLTHTLWGNAGAGWIGENLGFYGLVSGRAAFEAWREHRHHLGLRRLGHVAATAAKNLLGEYAVAEIVDFISRPLLMLIGQILALQLAHHLGSTWVAPWLAIGLILGKLAADVVFYALALISRNLQQRWQIRRLSPRPYLLMDLDRVTGTYDEFRRIMPGIDVHYAMKCNPHRRLLRHLRCLGSQFEIASLGELRELMKIGVRPAEVIFSNPTKMAGHILGAYRLGVRWFAADNIDELRKLARYAPGCNVYLRLRTGDTDSTVPSEGKFGIGPKQTIDLMLAARDLQLIPAGLAFHVGSQMLNPQAWTTAIQRCGQIMDALDREHHLRITLLDLGGGFPAHYDEPNNKVPPLEEYGLAITDALDQLPYQPDWLVIEPGRGLVAEAGTLVATVIAVAERDDVSWAHLNVGAFQGVAEALETACTLRSPVTDSRGSSTQKLWRLTGPTCDSQDTFNLGVLLSVDLRPGDRVYLSTAGAYSTAYGTGFNHFPSPSVRYRRHRRR
jgi:ornithine decarboxylase